MPITGTATSRPQAITRSDIVQLGQALPAAPRIMAQLAEMLDDIDVDISDIARQVRTDPGLTTRVIRVSNSAMFGAGGEVTDVEQALARVGFSNVMSLIGAAGVSQLSVPLVVYSLDVDTFQQASLCHALAAENLARRVGEDPNAAYIAALLRGIGMIVLDRSSETWLSPEMAFQQAQHPTYAEFERRTFGVTSADASRILLDEWGFPDAIVTAVEHHHLAEPRALENRLACIVNIAGEIAATAGRGLPGDQPHWTTAPGKYDVVGIDHTLWDELCKEAAARFTSACSAISMG